MDEKCRIRWNQRWNRIESDGMSLSPSLFMARARGEGKTSKAKEDLRDRLSMHFIFDVFVHLRKLALEVEMDVEIEVPLVSFVGLRRKGSMQFFPLLYRQVIVKVEHRLLPMCIRAFGTGRESDSFVAVSEFDVKETNQSVNVVVSPHGELKRR